MKRLLKHLRIYMFRGLLAIIPIFLSFLAIRLLYVLIDKRVMTFLGQFIEVRRFPGLGILLVLLCLYLVGLIISNVVGQQVLHFIDRVGKRIPFIQAIYQVGRQVSEGLSGLQEKQPFKKVLLVDWNSSGVWVIAFLAGEVIDEQTGESLYRLFMPHVPNPTTGFILMAKKSQTIDPGWTVEEAVKLIVSGGIISPREIKNKNTDHR